MNLQDAQAQLDAAATVFAEKAADLRSAQSAHVTALNALNRAQKAFDSALAEYRKSRAPHDTDWGRPPARGEPA